MKPERRERIEHLYRQALQCGPAEREPFLQRMCAGDEALHKEIALLLADHDRIGSFLEFPALAVTAGALTRDQAGSSPTGFTGRALSHFRMAEKIGGGGMGVVYRARDEHLQRDVAVKILSDGTLSEETSRKRFRKEALAVASLNHPNVAGVYDFDTQEGVDFLVMEYVPGVTLDRKLTAGPLPEKEIVRLAMQLAEGLAAAQAQGIVHRDLKPRNLMVTADGQLKILDFGLATLTRRAGSQEITASSTDQHKAWGTLPYMSPEQLSGDTVDIRSDIYAVGTILYEIITGRLPFQAAPSAALAAEIVNKTPIPPGQLRPGLSPRLEEVVLKCLEKDPEIRYQSAKELLVDLRRLSLPPMAHAAAFEARRRSRTGRPWKAAVVLLALALLVIAILWIKSRPAAPLPDYKPFQVTRAPGWQGDPALSPDGNEIAYTSSEGGNLDLYLADTHGNGIVQLTNNPADDSQPCWYPDGKAIAFTSKRGGTDSIWKTIPASGQEVLLVADARHPAISPDGNSIAFARKATPDASYRIYVSSLLNPADARIVTGDNAGLGDHGDPAWSPDSREICYSSRHGLWIVAAAGGAAHNFTSQAELDFDPVWPRDSSYIYFSSLRGMMTAIWRVGIRGGEPKPLTMGTGSESHPTVSRDGKRLAYATGGNFVRQQTLLVDRKTGNRTTIPFQDWEFMAAVAPDGRRIVFASARASEYTNLWIQDLAGNNLSGKATPLTKNNDNASHPVFSPDGLWIAYYRIIGTQRDIWTMPAAGGLQVQFTDHPAKDIHPAWSPDGSYLAFVSDRAGGQQVWVAPVKAGRPSGPARQLTAGGVSATAPAWFSDGRSLMFVGYEGGHSEVWAVASDGKTAARQITHGAEVWRARWDPLYGDILASAAWGKGRVVLWLVSQATGTGHPIVPEVEFGGTDAYGMFDLSRDGRILVWTRTPRASGNVWILEATSGAF